MQEKGKKKKYVLNKGISLKVLNMNKIGIMAKEVSFFPTETSQEKKPI